MLTAGSNRRQWILASVWFAVLTVLFTWPLPLQAAGHVVDRFGDNMQFVWLVGWFQEAIFRLHILPFETHLLNFPQGWSLARSEITPIQIALGMPFGALGGPVLGYNMALLATFVLSGLTAFYWVRRLTQDFWAAVLAGTLFAFLPFRVAHFRAGHLNVDGTMWFPLYFMGVFGLLTDHRPPRWIAPLTGVSLGLISLTSQYAFYMTLVVTLMAVGAYLLFRGRAGWPWRPFWRQVAIAILWALPLIAIGEWPYFRLALEGSLPARSIRSVSGGSASVTDFFLPSTDHFVVGGWIGAHFSRDHWIEGTLYIGALGMALAPLGAFFGLRTQRLKRITLLLLLLVGSGLIVTLGTYLYWNEAKVQVAVPTVLRALVGSKTTAIPLPGYLLAKYLPFYLNMRTFKRSAIFVLLATCTLAGIGASELKARLPGQLRTPLVLALIFFAILDFYPGPFPTVAVPSRPVDAWLSSQPDNGAVAAFPFGRETDQLEVYYSIVNGKPFLGGFFSAYPPQQYLRIQPVLDKFPDQESLVELRQLGIRYVLVAESSYPDLVALNKTLADHGLSLAGRFGGQAVYQLGGGK
jgi:hypothetical protein